MRLLILVTFALLPLLSSAEPRQTLKLDTIERTLKENNLVLVAFTSGTLETLQPFQSVFDEVAKSVKIPCITFDCEEETQLCEEYDINAYPAVRLFKKRETENETGSDGPKMELEVLRYRGKKTKNAIHSFVTKHELPVLTHVNPDALSEFKAIDDIVVLAYLRPDQHALLEEFRSVATKHYSEYVFGYTTDMATADAEGRAMPSIACYKNNDGDHTIISAHFTAQDVERFLDMAKKNIIGDFSERNMETYMARDKLTVYIFAATEDDAISMRHELTPVAKKFEKYVKFGVADAVEYAPMAENFGLSAGVFPALAIHAPMNDNMFTYREDRRIVGSVVDAMLTTILQGKAVPGQVFGDDAPGVGVEGHNGDTTHDEL